MNHLARRGRLDPGGELFGRAFENWLFHELSAYRGFGFELAYWRLASGIEVDFVVEDLCLAVEAKATRRVHTDHLKGPRELAADHRVGRCVVVSLDERARSERGWRVTSGDRASIRDGDARARRR